MRPEADELRAIAADLGALRPKSIAHVAALGLLAGALYSLLEAAACDYEDSRSDPSSVPFADEFAQTLLALSQQTAPPRAWQSGFYFNSALMRLDALDTRLAIMLKSKPLYDGPVRLSVNALKHDVDAHVSGQNTVTFGQAVEAAQRLKARLQQANS